jgi:RNA polymerase sigma-70 factor (ECF subfamily)
MAMVMAMPCIPAVADVEHGRALMETEEIPRRGPLFIGNEEVVSFLGVDRHSITVRGNAHVRTQGRRRRIIKPLMAMQRQLRPSLALVETPVGAPTMEMVVAQYSPYVATIGFRILGRGSDLDDLLQDVFLEAHRNLHTLKDWDALRPWLATVTVRAARRMLRLRQLARTLLPFASLPSFDPVDPNTSADEMLLYERLYRALDRLPANHRIAWTLQVMQGESLQRIAETCGCSVAAVKRRISKAQDVVNRELGE